MSSSLTPEQVAEQALREKVEIEQRVIFPRLSLREE